MKDQIEKLRQAWRTFRTNDWVRRRQIGFLITALVVGEATACLACDGIEPLALAAGGIISLIYFCWYERCFQFWNGTHYQAVYYFASKQLPAMQYALCPLGTIAFLGAISMMRPVGIGWWLLSMIAVMLGINILEFYAELFAKMLDRYEEANEIISSMAMLKRMGRSLDDDDDLQKDVNKYTTTYFGQEFAAKQPTTEEDGAEVSGEAQDGQQGDL